MNKRPSRNLIWTSLLAAPLGCGGEPPTTDVETPDTSTRETSTEAAVDSDATTSSRVPPPADFVPIERLVITGAQILSEIQRNDAGIWEPVGFSDTTVVIENGVVVRMIDAKNYQLTPNDVVVSARGRWVMAAPIVFGPRSPLRDITESLSGGGLVDLTLAGVGGFVVPVQAADSAAGRCATSRRDEREIPSAEIFGVDAVTYDALDDSYPRIAALSDAASTLEDWMDRRLAAGDSTLDILSALTTQAAERLGRTDLGRVEIGSRSGLLILDGDPLTTPFAVLDPFALTFGDRAIRRAEIEVLRDASMRGDQLRRDTSDMVPEAVASDSVRRWVTSTQGQVFAGLAVGGEAGDVAFVSRVGQPRFDRSDGRVRLDPKPGTPNFELVYQGPPQSFTITTTAAEAGLAIDLRPDGADPIEAEAAGPTAPPVIDLPLDLDVRRERISTGGKVVLELQELLYGSGPIGLAPRRYELTPMESVDCPPCFEGCDPVYRLEVFDPERGEDIVAGVMIVGFRDGRPSRGRFETATGPIWFDELPGPGRTAID